MTWTPETNRIPFGLLTDDENAALRACKHGWEFYNCDGEWRVTDEKPQWFMGTIYRAKPAPPKRIMTWLLWDKTYGFSVWNRRSTVLQQAVYGGWVKRIECNEDGSDVVVTDVEVIE